MTSLIPAPFFLLQFFSWISPEIKAPTRIGNGGRRLQQLTNCPTIHFQNPNSLVPLVQCSVTDLNGVREND